MSRESFSEGENLDKKIVEGKLKNENKPENLEEGKKELSPEEIKTLEREMNDYTQGLKIRIDEIKAELETKPSKKKVSELLAQMEELQAEYDGLSEMAEDIETGNFESITEKPAE